MTPQRVGPRGAVERGRPPGFVWYAAYGSNTHVARLNSYLAGGVPPGGAREYPGCRDARPPLRSVPLELPGRMYFATRSPVWSGGRAFYDADAPGGQVRARAHLLTVAQFSDIAAQEMYRAPGTDLDLGEVLRHGRARLGDGRYETLLYPGDVDGHPVLTFTAPWGVGGTGHVRPSAAYLRHIAEGLAESGAWDLPGIAAYLAECADGEWEAREITALLGP
ncbi:histone deacetylase [Streptomyces sp. ME01-24h]|nr:histone deacetylase [Streptomyces sp. ME19-03-3]MDX3357327.1 histone deacetylase [Streptomyces sp. ME01-24h]